MSFRLERKHEDGGKLRKVAVSFEPDPEKCIFLPENIGRSFRCRGDVVVVRDDGSKHPIFKDKSTGATATIEGLVRCPCKAHQGTIVDDVWIEA